MESMTIPNTTPPAIPEPSTAPAAAPVAPVAPPPAAPAAPAAPFAVFPDSASFNARLDRETRTRLKEMGVEDPEQVKTLLAEHTALKAEAEKKRLENLSELEREKEARTKAENELAAERTRAANAAMETQLFKLYAEHGVKNYDFATFAISQARAKVPDPSKFDAAEFLKTLKEDPAQAAALGLVGVTSVGASTTEATKDTPPKGAPPPTTKPVKDMTPEEFRQHVERTTGYTPR